MEEREYRIIDILYKIAFAIIFMALGALIWIFIDSHINNSYDVNGDGKVDLIDLIDVRNYIIDHNKTAPDINSMVIKSNL